MNGGKRVIVLVTEDQRGFMEYRAYQFGSTNHWLVYDSEQEGVTRVDFEFPDAFKAGLYVSWATKNNRNARIWE